MSSPITLASQSPQSLVCSLESRGIQTTGNFLAELTSSGFTEKYPGYDLEVNYTPKITVVHQQEETKKSTQSEQTNRFIDNSQLLKKTVTRSHTNEIRLQQQNYRRLYNIRRSYRQIFHRALSTSMVLKKEVIIKDGYYQIEQESTGICILDTLIKILDAVNAPFYWWLKSTLGYDLFATKHSSSR